MVPNVVTLHSLMRRLGIKGDSGVKSKGTRFLIEKEK